MKTRNIKKQFNTVNELGFKNLYVGGASFTYNNSEDHLVAWPYYLRDLGGFENVIDSSLPGAGNYHIMQSLIWTLEQHKPNVNDTLVVVMRSGINKDDKIIAEEFLNDYPFRFEYAPGVVAGISGGTLGSNGNHNAQCDKNVKNADSRSVENYIYYTALYHYLKSNNYNFVILNDIDPSLPNRGGDFPNNYNTAHLFDNLQSIYEYSVRNDLLDNDDYHPSPNGHLAWTREILLPYLVDKFK